MKNKRWTGTSAIWLAFAVAAIALYVGSTIALIGEVPDPNPEPYRWDSPIKVLVMFLIPTVSGFLAAFHLEDKS